MAEHFAVSTTDRGTWRGPAPLGVGLPYLPGIDPAIYRSGLAGFVEVTPDILCRPRLARGGVEIDPRLLETAREACGELPIAVHGVELSIGSAGRWNSGYVAMLEHFQQLWPFEWHSEHLHFQTVDLGDGRGEVDTGVPLPLPFTHEAAALVAGRAARLNTLFGKPFLLENGAHYLGELPCEDGIRDESAFLNRIAVAGDCGFLLDLHNLHCNAVNNGIDPLAMLAGLRLDWVGEIHLAGGSWADGYRMDSHDGGVPEPVWDLLEEVLPRCSGIAGLVFEIMPAHAERVGTGLIARELERARSTWERLGMAARAEPCRV